jgi:hypothetical protein
MRFIFFTQFNKTKNERSEEPPPERVIGPAIAVFCLLIVGAVVFLTGIRWGLPTHAVDPFLFGGRGVWSGRQILALAGSADQDKDRASDVSSKPLSNRDRAVEVNGTDEDRARIVRRYRLMSYQPDEFTTFAALSRMKPSRADLDPRMYKYGGLWVYPIGAMLRIAASMGFVQLTPDAAYYLDHPEAFGRFYIVARLYSVIWGLIGIVAIFFLIRRITGNAAAAAFGALSFALMPVVVNAAHEAKPHLAGTVLMLLAVLSGARFVESGKRKIALTAALLCGAAIGMVPSAVPVLLVLPGMSLLRRSLHPTSPRNRLPGIFARESLPLVLMAMAVYAITNPYVPINFIHHRALLYSNLGNSSGFYHAGLSAGSFFHALMLICAGTSIVPALLGAIGAIALAWRAFHADASRQQEARRRATGLLLAVATLPVAIVFVLFATAQPADYARFALPFEVFLLIEAVVALATFLRSAALRYMTFILFAILTAASGIQYVAGFIRDCSNQTTRLATAEVIRSSLGMGNNILASWEEPAPWSLPPVDLFRWHVIVPPRGWPHDQPYAGARLTTGPSDFSGHQGDRQMLSLPSISWADKSFPILMPRRK